ncbi:hypothetical protein GDO81_024679 [Engystomops pustulosus]|uniref:Uncharacterized protein n=1 Tax=Engystomops pustulosus TaxID=76066 RepID=A0AAV6YIP1_ENGPU|nr:hypothetical protein GDO81_024679 [Engystomops pustulosus]
MYNNKVDEHNSYARGEVGLSETEHGPRKDIYQICRAPLIGRLMSGYLLSFDQIKDKCHIPNTSINKYIASYSSVLSVLNLCPFYWFQNNNNDT